MSDLIAIYDEDGKLLGFTDPNIPIDLNKPEEGWYPVNDDIFKEEKD